MSVGQYENHVVFGVDPGGTAVGYLQPVTQGSPGTYDIEPVNPDASDHTVTSVTGHYWYVGSSATTNIAAGSLTVSGGDIEWAINTNDVATAGERWVVFTDQDGVKSRPILQVVLEDAAEDTTPSDATNPAYSETVQDVADLVTLTGVAANSTELGTFTGSFLTGWNNTTIKGLFQVIKTWLEANLPFKLANQPMSDLDREAGVAATGGATKGTVKHYATSVDNNQAWVKLDTGRLTDASNRTASVEIGFAVSGDGNFLAKIGREWYGMEIQDSYYRQGIKYSADLSATVVDRSLVDKGWVLSVLPDTQENAVVIPVGVDGVTQELSFPEIYDFSGAAVSYASLTALRTALFDYLEEEDAAVTRIELYKRRAEVAVFGIADDTNMPDRVAPAAPAAPTVSWLSGTTTLDVGLADALGNAIVAADTSWGMNIQIGYGDSDSGGETIDTYTLSAQMDLGTAINTIDWAVNGVSWSYPSDWLTVGNVALKAAFGGSAGGDITVNWASVASALGGTANERAFVKITLISVAKAMNSGEVTIAST